MNNFSLFIYFFSSDSAVLGIGMLFFMNYDFCFRLWVHFFAVYAVSAFTCFQLHHVSNHTDTLRHDADTDAYTPVEINE